MIEINNHQLNIELYGPESGQAVVLLHHGLGTTRSWRNQIPTLVDLGFRVIVYDRWGFGLSADRSELDIPWFTSDQDDLKSILSKLHIDRVSLIGHSDGATIAILFAVTYPRCLNSLVITGTHIYIDECMRVGIDQVYQRYHQDPSFRRALSRQHGKKVDHIFYSWYAGWSRLENLKWDLRPFLHQVNCPAFIIQGENDEHATTQQALDLANGIKHSELWLVPNANHMVPQENPNLFNQRLTNFYISFLKPNMNGRNLVPLGIAHV